MRRVHAEVACVPVELGLHRRERPAIEERVRERIEPVQHVRKLHPIPLAFASAPRVVEQPYLSANNVWLFAH